MLFCSQGLRLGFINRFWASFRNYGGRPCTPLWIRRSPRICRRMITEEGIRVVAPISPASRSSAGKRIAA